ncbi:MAG TPA: thioredoxin family protein [Noviherbaspirillum sp.]|nr:thioredoxin family protein [Noviherbaspirillum sp.]
MLSTALPASAAGHPYDEKADAHALIAQAMGQAQSSGKNVLIVFGANWCPDCLRLDPAIHDRNGKLGDEHFNIIKVNVGRFDKNLDLARTYGNPISKGIPGAAIVTPQGATLYAGPLISLISPYQTIKTYVRQAVAPLGMILIAVGAFFFLRRKRLAFQRT